MNVMKSVPAYLMMLALVALCPGAASAQELIYQIEQGDTLMAIGVALLADPDDWVQLQRINKVRDPRRLPVGKTLRIPYDLLSPIPRSAQIVAVAGDARLDGRAAVTGDRVGVGSSLETADDGHIAIALPDGSSLILPARSTASVETLQGYAGTDEQSVDISLERGRIESRVEPQRGPGARYRIETPTAVVGVRGTDFRAEVVTGSVGLRPSLGSKPELRVEGGFGLVADGDQMPGATPLLPPPDAGTLPELFERPLVRMPMPSLDGAVAWRAQVVRAEAPLPVLFDRVVEDGVARIPNLPDGDYRLRVRGIDANGLEGFDASHAFRLKARPEPPFNGNPGEGRKVPAGNVTLSWTHAPEAARYLVELSTVPDQSGAGDDASAFSAPLHSARTRATTEQVALEAGRYVWRVASVRHNGERGPWSDPVAFSVRPLQALSEPPEVSDDEMLFRWGGEPGQRFEYQFSDDGTFARTRAAGETTAPELVMPKPSFGTYYLRIRSIDADGYVNAWSGAQRVEVPGPWWLVLLPLIAL